MVGIEGMYQRQGSFCVFNLQRYDVVWPRSHIFALMHPNDSDTHGCHVNNNAVMITGRTPVADLFLRKDARI